MPVGFLILVESVIGRRSVAGDGKPWLGVVFTDSQPRVRFADLALSCQRGSKPSGAAFARNEPHSVRPRETQRRR